MPLYPGSGYSTFNSVQVQDDTPPSLRESIEPMIPTLLCFVGIVGLAAAQSPEAQVGFGALMLSCGGAPCLALSSAAADKTPDTVKKAISDAGNTIQGACNSGITAIGDAASSVIAAAGLFANQVTQMNNEFHDSTYFNEVVALSTTV